MSGVLKLTCPLESPTELVKTQSVRPNTQTFLFGKSEMGLRVCILNKFPSNTDAAGQGPHFKTSVSFSSLQARKPNPKQTNKFMPIPSDKKQNSNKFKITSLI